MSDNKPGIYLIVEFDWPESFDKETGALAKKLHDLTQDADWIKETLAASGGVGAGPSSLWVFWLPDYAALDRLFHDREDEISQTYNAFFSRMARVDDKVRGEVAFM